MEETQVLGNFFDLIEEEVLPLVEQKTIETKEVTQAYLRPIPPQYTPKTKEELEYIFVKFFDNRMAKFQLVERVGKVYLCKFLPITRIDPVLAWVDIDNENFDFNFNHIGRIFLADPFLRNPSSIKEITGWYEKNKKILKSILTKEEFDFYCKTTEKTITNPWHYIREEMVEKVKKPNLSFLYGTLFVSIVASVFTFLLMVFR